MVPELRVGEAGLVSQLTVCAPRFIPDKNAKKKKIPFLILNLLA
jgi:hypothetical protein